MVCGVGVRRGVAWGVRSQVVGMATSRGAREDFISARVAFPAHALPAHALPAITDDAVNGKYEKKTVTVDAPRYQVVLVVDTNLGSADMYLRKCYGARHQDSRIKI